MSTESDEFLNLLKRDGLATHPAARLIPLTGGVSSEIYLVEDGDDRYVVKRALAKLKVQDDWFADVGRNATEHRFISTVSRFMPQSVPQPRFANHDAGYFAMEYLGDGFENWKKLMLAGEMNESHARSAGEMLGTLQKQTWGQSHLLTDFDTTVNFRELRIEPYLLTTADRTPQLSPILRDEAVRIEGTRRCLVHGDFSPKNILIHPARMVLVDCEVAWFGDPAFDPAFLLSHLFLKALYHVPKQVNTQNMISVFWDSFAAQNDRADASLQSRVVRLMLMLMLARVNGKSKVEYLDANKADIVRTLVERALLDQQSDLNIISSKWHNTLHTTKVS